MDANSRGMEGEKLTTWPASVREQYQLMIRQQTEYEETIRRVSRNDQAGGDDE